ncbi:MAG: class I SAM-dependent methyltransferase, partial [Limisphaerales bacterium]
MKLPMRSIAGLWVSALLLIPACRHQPATATPPERSVAPGINAEYLKPGLDVDQWVERFEKEGREIYDQRDRIVDATGVKPGLVVADIGAGSGLFTLEFAGRVGPRGTVYAV